MEEGSLTLTAVVKDNEGNVSSSISGTATKLANAPVVTYEAVKRDNATTAKITNLKSTNTADKMYYLVKGIDQAAPSVDEVINKNTSITTTLAANTGIIIPDDLKDEACVIYVAAQTTSGTESEKVLAIKVAKADAKQIEGNVTIQKVTGTDATFAWKFNENVDGFVGYRVLLQSGNTILDEQIVQKGEAKEIDFFEILKKQNAGKYTVKVIALADNVNYTDSNAATIDITTTAVVSKITIALDKENGKLTWTPTGDVKNVKDYTVEVAKYDSSKETNKEYENIIASLVTTNTEYDITSIVKENGVGTYQFKVTANAKDDILMANVSSADMKKSNNDNVKYHQGIGINNLSAEIKDGKVLVKGTLLSEDLFDVTTFSSLVTYKLYYKEASEKSYIGEGISITELPYEVGTLNPGTEYKFMLMTEVKNDENAVQKYYSNEPSVTTAITPIVIDNATYVKTEEGSPVIPELESNQVTYSEGILYVKNNSSTIEYSSEIYPEVKDIVSVLAQMGEEDTISVNNSAITALTLQASDKVATTYDLTKVPKTAKVEITGDATYTTTVMGELNSISLKTSATKFDLSKLSVSKVTVEDDNMDLIVNPKAVLNFASGKGNVTVNSVKLSQNTTLSSVTISENGFRFTGSANKLTVDASKATENVEIEFVGTNQKGLEITANADNAVKVLTNSQEIKDLEIKSGKVDVSSAVFTSLKVSSAAGTNTITLITNSSNTDSTVVGKELTTDPTLLDWLGYYLTASANKVATYSADAGSKEIVFTLNGSATVTLNQKSEELTANKTNSVEDTPMAEDSNSTEYKRNMEAIENITVDSKTNTITVKVNENMKPYKDSHAYYTLLIDVGVPRENLEIGRDKGQEYYEITQEDIDASEAYGADPTEVLVWLYAEDAKSIVDFVTKTGEHLYFTVIVEGYVEE